jgi:hypothetical protein
MKYIKRLNIDFDNWIEFNECTYLIFRNVNKFYIGYIIKKSNKYRIILLNDNDIFNINILQNINEIPSKQTNIHYKLRNTILYDDLIVKISFY